MRALSGPGMVTYHACKFTYSIVTTTRPRSLNIFLQTFYAKIVRMCMAAGKPNEDEISYQN
jgi:hypothetical protein